MTSLTRTIKWASSEIITYDSQVHFYNINNVGEDIPAVTMSDVDDPFAPLPASALLINVAQGKDRIMQLIDMLVEVFSGNPGRLTKTAMARGAVYIVGKLLEKWQCVWGSSWGNRKMPWQRWRANTCISVVPTDCWKGQYAKTRGYTTLW